MSLTALRNATQADILLQIREAVLKATDARAIYLFGSRAQGAARPDSDYDILVVTWDTGSASKIRSSIRTALEGAPVSLDVLVKSPAEFEWRRRFANTIEKAVDREGIVLHLADASEDVMDIVNEWFVRADSDLEFAEWGLTQEGLTAGVCFHAQQCIEKYLKGFLTLVGIEAERTHDLERLLEQCSQADEAFAQWRERVKGMSDYAVETRYPGGALPSHEEARNAVATAREMRDFVLSRVRQKRNIGESQPS